MTCHRLDRFYCQNYVTIYSNLFDFGNQGEFLSHFARLHTLGRCTFDGWHVGILCQFYQRITDITLLIDIRIANICTFSEACPWLKRLKV
mmetsp:Transcript_24729/g.61823  ORF Transcript_24729/g.61823 Transcript_24729/m.61823 type:complete len:90 (-) Transcript_24729:46-315(-)